MNIKDKKTPGALCSEWRLYLNLCDLQVLFGIIQLSNSQIRQ